MKVSKIIMYSVAPIAFIIGIWYLLKLIKKLITPEIDRADMSS